MVPKKKNKNIVRITIFLCLSFFSIVSGQNISNFTSDLPIFIINTNISNIPNDFKVDATLKVIANENGNLNHYTDAANEYDGKIGIEIRGSSSAWYPQTPYGFETRMQDGENLNVSILGLPEENDWVLLSNYNDKSLMRNVLGYQLFESLGHYAPRAKHVSVIVNGTYEGIYIFTEKIKRDKNRVDIAKLRPEDQEGEELTGGYIFKIDYFNLFNSWTSPHHPIGFPQYNIHFVFHDPNHEELSNIQESYLQNYVTDFEDALYGGNFQDPNNGYEKYIDVQSFIDYFIVSEVSRNNDGFKKSRYFHKDKNGKIKAGPVWDFDWAWKNIDECSIFKATNGSGWSYKVNECNPDIKSPGWMIRLFQDPNFKNATNCRYYELRASILSGNSIESRIDSLAEVVANAQFAHFLKWNILGINVGAPEVGIQPLTFAGEVQKLKNWVAMRLNWLDLNMVGSCTPTDTKEEIAQTAIKVYPIPAQDMITIEVDEHAENLLIFDLMGKQVAKQLINGQSQIMLDSSNLSSGVYFIKLTGKAGEFGTAKLTISR